MRQLWRQLLFKPKEKLDPALVHDLKQQFHGEVAKLSALLGRDLFSLWGYAPPGESSSRTDAPRQAAGNPAPLSATHEL